MPRRSKAQPQNTLPKDAAGIFSFEIPADLALTQTHSPKGNGKSGPASSTENSCLAVIGLPDQLDRNLPTGPFPFQAGSEPIQEFELNECLGNGGFGSVWSAKGPGGLPVAIKFLWLGSAKSGTEWNGLKHCRNFRHPHLLSLLGFWVVNGWLLIVSELAETDLHSQFQKAKANGREGLEQALLFPWFRDSAEGLDYLQTLDPAITHGDVKPGNMLIIGGRCKVGDFGSLRPTGNGEILRLPGTTHYFAAPETENGSTHPNSDQYSLALSYAILRGVCPFTEEEKHDSVKLINCLSRANLSKPETKALSKALRRNPNERHGSCLAMVHSFFE